MSLNQVLSIGTLEHKIEGILNDFELNLIDKSVAKSAFADILLSWTEQVAERTLNYHLQTAKEAREESKGFDKIYLAAVKAYDRSDYHAKTSVLIDYLSDYLRVLLEQGTAAKRANSPNLQELRLKFAGIRQLNKMLIVFEQYGIRDI